MTNSETNPTEPKIKIRNCVFGFRCAQNWHEMNKTSQVGVRYCRECAKEVYAVADEYELFEAISLNRCVAIKQPSRPERLGDRGLDMILGMVRSYEDLNSEPDPEAYVAFRKTKRNKKIT